MKININQFKHRGHGLLMIATIGLLPLSFTNDFPNEELKGYFSSQTFYQNDKQAWQALTGVYNAIAFNSFNNSIWVFGDVAS
jgi:hypothetical protein